MFGFSESKDARDEVYEGQPHESKLSHEVIGGAAAFEAMRVFDKGQREKGETVKHGWAKEALAGIAGAEVDKLFETKGLDFIDKERAKSHAKQNAQELYDQHYGDMDEYNPNAREAHESLDGY